MTLPTPKRVLSIDGVYNFRDLGGYPAGDGRQTRWRTLFRSDSLHRLTLTGVRSVRELGVRSVVDLRYAAECTDQPCALTEEAVYHSLPLFEDPQRGAEGFVPDLDAIYRLMVDTRQAQLVATWDRLAAPEVLPAVVNCTAGKDRTGVVIALLLDLLGVHRPAIIADYTASGALLRSSPLGDQLRARIAARGGDPALADRLLVSPPEHMERLLSYVDGVYGGAEVLARQAGLAPERIQVLRAALLE